MVTLLEATRNHVIEAYILDIAGSGLHLRMPESVSCGTPVKIEGNNTLMLGDVCRCEPAEGAFMVGVQLSGTLSPLTELEQLNRALVGEAERKVEFNSESDVLRR